MTIAVDFDGTIVEHRYPEIGREIPFAIETLKMLSKEVNMPIGEWTTSTSTNVMTALSI